MIETPHVQREPPSLVYSGEERLARSLARKLCSLHNNLSTSAMLWDESGRRLHKPYLH